MPLEASEEDTPETPESWWRAFLELGTWCYYAAEAV